MAQSSVYYVFKEIIAVLLEILPQHIIWPNNYEASVEVFRERSGGFPVRSVIECAFGRLKGKFRRLRDLDVCDAETGIQVITAACVLHNFIIEHDYDDEEYEYDNELPLEVEDENIPRKSPY
ncbi:DDE Tnp 4 domain containing protein, partial [Asbolus verrucosus]